MHMFSCLFSIFFAINVNKYSIFFQIYKRNLEDNLKLRKAQKEIETCEKDLAVISEKLSGVNTDMISEKGPLITEQTQIFREKAQTEGQLSELKVTNNFYLSISFCIINGYNT